MGISISLESLGEEVAIEILSSKHLTAIQKFCSGEEEQDTFLKENAEEEYSVGLSAVYIIRAKSHDDIVSFFTLSPSIIRCEKEHNKVLLSIRSYYLIKKKNDINPIRKTFEKELGIPLRYNSVPVILLGQFAVNQSYQHKGAGTEILRKVVIPIAIKKALTLSGIGLVLHAKKDVAKGFYRKKASKELPRKFKVIAGGKTYTLFYSFVKDMREYRKKLMKDP